MLAGDASNFCRHNGRILAGGRSNKRSSCERDSRSIGTSPGRALAAKNPKELAACMMAASVRSRAGAGPANKAATSITGMLKFDMVLRLPDCNPGPLGLVFFAVGFSIADFQAHRIKAKLWALMSIQS